MGGEVGACVMGGGRAEGKVSVGAAPGTPA